MHTGDERETAGSGQPKGKGLDALMSRVRADEDARARLLAADPATAGKLMRLRQLLGEIRRRLALSRSVSRSDRK